MPGKTEAIIYRVIKIVALENMEYIEAYFYGELSAEGKKEFEQRIVTVPSFAEEVAFYLSSKQAAAEEMKTEKEKFKKIYEQYKQDPAATPQPGLLQKLKPWLAAAAVMAGIAFGWYIWFRPVSTEAMADKYITENFQTLPVTMSSKEDSLQTGLRLYNEGNREAALKQFEIMLRNDTTFIEAKKYAGIVSLRLGLYDKAINYFSELANYQLYSNPGKFYQALTLLKRNRPGDTETAKQLLQQVVENDLEGKKEAETLLRKW